MVTSASCFPSLHAKCKVEFLPVYKDSSSYDTEMWTEASPRCRVSLSVFSPLSLTLRGSLKINT